MLLPHSSIEKDITFSEISITVDIESKARKRKMRVPHKISADI